MGVSEQEYQEIIRKKLAAIGIIDKAQQTKIIIELDSLSRILITGYKNTHEVHRNRQK